MLFAQSRTLRDRNGRVLVRSAQIHVVMADGRVIGRLRARDLAWDPQNLQDRIVDPH